MIQSRNSLMAFSTLRLSVALAFGLLGAGLALVSFAANPASGTLSPSNLTINYSGSGPYLVPSTQGDTCAAPDQCDEFALTVAVPSDYAVTNPSAKVRVAISWPDPSGAAADFDFYIRDAANVQVGGTSGATSANPEVIEFAAGSGTRTFTVRVKPYLPAGLNYTGKVTLLPGDIASPTATPTPPPFVGIAPRYYNYSPGPGVGENAGEPTIGFNLTTKRAMFISGLQTLRIDFPQDGGACDAIWTDVSYVLTSKKSLDPILWTDQAIGRTFVSQLDSVVPPASPVLIGLNSLFAYTDNDGDSWTPAQINPPDGSYDHQAVGSGPYPAALAALSNPVNKSRAVYYCSQAGVTAFCSRSDDGGLNFGPSTTPYNVVTDGCGGLHGHQMVAPDGTVYLPNRGCNGVQSVSVSTNGGETWTVRQVKGTSNGTAWTAKAPPGIIDPAVGIADDGTVYFAYVSGETDGGHPMVSISRDRGLTWGFPSDVGASAGLKNAVFPRAIAGDSNRAAVGFIATTQSGDHQVKAFTGTWFAYVATTYDGGVTWATVNATPGDPVQKESCIWNQGGSNPCRNLLDFNGMTKDDKGRALYGFADGCINECVSGGPNSFSAKATIARQSGGRSLYARFDPAEPALPQAACLTGRRDDLASYLSWKVPDNGGSPILAYKILRGTTPNNLVQIGTGDGSKKTYTDRSADPGVVTYYYQIVAQNQLGDGIGSNILPLVVGPRVEPTGACVLPGVQVVVDPAGDATDAVTQHDITSVSISEPENLAGKLVFTMKIVNLAAPIPPDARYAVRFGAPTPPAPDPVLGAQEDYFVAFISGTNQFTYGTTGVPPNAPGRFFNTLGTLDAASNITPDGTITLVLPKSVIGNPTPGQAITSVFGSVRVNGPTGGTNETIFDSTGTGSYQLRSATLCQPNTAPFAALSASPVQGLKPLLVHFDASASKDPDAIDTIASYTFNFGDGGNDVTQSSPLIDHTFTQEGLYLVKCVVTDSRGKVSSNTAQQLIEVNVLYKVSSRFYHGLAGVFDIDLPSDGTTAAAIEPRLPEASSTYQLIYKFQNQITSPGTATIQQGTGTVGPATLGPGPTEVTVNVSNVTNAQHLIVNLTGVQDNTAFSFGPLQARLDVLIGDVNGSGRVDGNDVSATQAQTRQPANASTFRLDVNKSGRIDGNDVSAVQGKTRTRLP